MRSPAARTAPYRQRLRNYSTEPPQLRYEQPAPQPPARPNLHREFYRGGAGRAVMFNFLVAMATFQVIYWGWLKLESLEVKREKESEIKSLEGELKALSEKAEKKVEDLTGTVGGVEGKEAKKKGWFGW
ncbi:unnamed protein product [Lecanosticta acicola]|uniref:Unnamed protein product n=1 Tax=Lecanosticta acicola TaxID=111012 RepID=A0AAI8YYW3_9PEZI|nr:unnamed protein product [Lecanosticta acicola]